MNRYVLMFLALLAAPVSGQTPAQLRAYADSVRARAVQTRAFNRSAETSMTALLAMLDTLTARIARMPTGTTPPPVTPPPADTTSPPPPPSGSSFLNRNRPAGLTTRLSDDFNRTLAAGSSDAQITAFATAGGWSDHASWVNGNIKTVVDASGPNAVAGKRNLWSTAPAGSQPGGAVSLVESLGAARSQVYLYVSFKFEPGYPHNTNSEKLIYFDNSPQNIIWEWADGAQILYNVDDPTNAYPQDSGGFLRANRRPMGAQFPQAPVPAAGVWQQLEIFMDANANTVQWWIDGVLYASYTGVTDFDPIREVMLDDTWGGSGTKANATSGRVIEMFVIATN